LRERTVTVDGSAASAFVRRLWNGNTYTARVTAYHGEVAGPPALSAPFEPNPAPGPPQSVTASAGEQSATVRWGPPAGGGPVDRYRVVAMPGGVSMEVPGAQTSALVQGLRNRARQTFTVTALNGAGENVSAPSNPVWPGDDVPWYLFPLEFTYLLVLGVLAYLYAWHHQPLVIEGVAIPVLRDVVPPTVAGVPISIPWFGALGATLIGLYGIFDHSHRDWQRSLNKWHVSRPFTGAVLGTVGFILFASVIRATGVNVPANLNAQDPLGKLVYFAIAFVVGFREETFRTMIKRVADLIVGPGAKPDPASAAPSPAPAPAPSHPPSPAPQPSSQPRGIAPAPSSMPAVAAGTGEEH
jgi:hypothetical protein